MAPSYSSALQPPTPAPKVKEKDDLPELRSNGFWAAVITIGSYAYGEYFIASQMQPDVRQESWIMMRSAIPHLIFSLLYVAGVTWWGPQYMSTRKPVSGLRPYMMAYNAFQVVFSAYMFIEGGLSGWFNTYSWLCQPCDYSNDPQAIRMMHIGFWYHFSKYIDFMDTVFFVMNKKNQHISLLHMAHHGLMPISTWYGIRYHPGGHNTFFGFLNAFVHTVMYLYYLLAAMGPHMRPFLWWKKYLTTLQMTQFTAVFIHAMIPTMKECDVPPALIGWVGSIAVLFTVLFADFYIKEYKKKNINQVKIKTDKDAGYSSPNHCAVDQKSMTTTTTTTSHDSHFTNGITRRVTCATVSNGMMAH
ncbi:hypothetical protein O3P69_004615 [Scylla paramamosain]|uniref:Elongation of very long chain fatty acids protein n=1 Tax=Scylla paramamosain TaxID=85552 RepID=A0AAW0UI98_SCYPA